MKSKKDHAKDMINRIRTMKTEDLHDMIVNYAGEELSEFFMQYSYGLLTKDPANVVQNTSALMLMGYLIAKEEMLGGYKNTFPPSGGGGVGLA